MKLVSHRFTHLCCVGPGVGNFDWGNIPSEFTGVMLLTLLNGKGFKVPFGSDWIMAAPCCGRGRCLGKMSCFFGRGGGSGRGLAGAWEFENLDQVSWLIVVLFFCLWILCHISDFTQKDPSVSLLGGSSAKTYFRKLVKDKDYPVQI